MAFYHSSAFREMNRNYPGSIRAMELGFMQAPRRITAPQGLLHEIRTFPVVGFQAGNPGQMAGTNLIAARRTEERQARIRQRLFNPQAESISAMYSSLRGHNLE